MWLKCKFWLCSVKQLRPNFSFQLCCKIFTGQVATFILFYNKGDYHFNQNYIKIIITTHLGVESYLVGQSPTNWEHLLYPSKMDREFSHNRHIHVNTQMSLRAYFLTSLSEKMQKSQNHLQMLEQRQGLLLNYFKTLSIGLSGSRT